MLLKDPTRNEIIRRDFINDAMKIYTKTGDKGTTALFGGTRVPKHNLRIDSYGTVDELNSWMGLIRDQEISVHTSKIINLIQHHLFTLGAILATPPEKETLKNGKDRLNISKISDEEINMLETEMDDMDKELPPMTHFILPGGHPSVSYCHITRTVCRRAERLASELNEITPIDPQVLRYLNRLSDYLFVLARKLSKDLQAEEIKWIPNKY
ncbi:cob(I)alamin adenosyltransferase [Nonlabens xylanidelens]|uniref:Corrinoid adenosyltransferase n=3 Tax=Flavobacteriaceae TaxID=49546 RepID=A0A2S6IDT1_9FLAO|nr:cob(I)alamin adenosyltransferase [Nonlabens xylanidelens]